MRTTNRYEIGCQLVLITNRKSRTGFRLVPTSMTLNDLERRNSPYFAFFSPNSIALRTDYVTVVVDRPIMSVKYCFPVPVFHFWPKLTHSAARSLCNSWAIVCTVTVCCRWSLQVYAVDSLNWIEWYIYTSMITGNTRPPSLRCRLRIRLSRWRGRRLFVDR